MLGTELAISLQTFTTVLARYNLGEPHITLVGGEQWYPPEQRGQLVDAAHEELAALGLFQRGRIDEGFLDTVRLLQRPSVEYYAFCRVSDKPSSVRAAFAGERGIVAVSDALTLRLLPTEPFRAALDAAHQLPDTPPAALHSLSCALIDYEAIARGETLRGTASVADAKRALTWLKKPWTGSGQMYAAIRDYSGRRVRSEERAYWFDTSDGRFVAHVDRSGWLRILGADAGEVAGLWQRLETGIRH